MSPTPCQNLVESNNGMNPVGLKSGRVRTQDPVGNQVVRPWYGHPLCGWLQRRDVMCVCVPVSVCISVCLSVCPCTEPNDESAANVDAAKTWRDDRTRFNEIAERTVRKSLGL